MRSLSLPPIVQLAAVLPVLACGGGGGGGGGDPLCYDAAPVTGSAATFGARLAAARCYPELAMPGGIGQIAVRPEVFAGGLASCGACLELTGAAGTRVALVVEDCVGCGGGVDFDLDAETFEAVTGAEEGRIEIEARAVPCPVTGNLRWASSEGTNPYFVQLFALDHRHPLAAVQLRVAGAFVPLARSTFNAWEWTSGGETVEPPYTLRVTDVFGHVVDDTVDVAANGVGVGAVQLPVCR